jgi:hypothetical protein
MVLFAKSALTKAYLLSQRTLTTTKANNFAYLIKSVAQPFKKLPHPDHVKGRHLNIFKLNLHFYYNISLTPGVSMWRNLFLLAGIPAILLINANIMLFEDHHPKRPEFKPYEYMRKRQKVLFK